MTSSPHAPLHGIEKLIWIVARLRDPEQGCPWDLKQTHQSLKPYMLEEAYEAVEAIDRAAGGEASDSLCEELGDVLLQVLLHSRLAEEAGRFDFHAVCETIADKLIRRHPHVFEPAAATDSAINAGMTAEQVASQWEQIKIAEKSGASSGAEATGQTETVASDTPELSSILADVRRGQPALRRALETSRKAVKVGFEWPNLESLWECVMSEYEEFLAEIHALPPGADVPPERFARLEAEMGDIFFASVNLARHFSIDPEVALTEATARFTRRFQVMEQLLLKDLPSGQSLRERMAELDFARWDLLWRQAKALADN